MFWLLLSSAYTSLTLGFFHSVPQQVGQGCTKGWEGTTDHRDFPCFIMSSSEINAQGKDEDAGTFVVMVLVFPSSHQACTSMTFQEVPKHQPADGKQQMNVLFCFTCMHSFASPIKLSLPPAEGLLSFTFISLSPSNWGSCKIGLRNFVIFHFSSPRVISTFFKGYRIIGSQDVKCWK